MCRNIKPLFNFQPPASDDDVRAAALQFVRKISGYTKPSQDNQAAFDQAIAEITATSARLLDSLVARGAPRDRAAWEAKKRAAFAKRAARDRAR